MHTTWNVEKGACASSNDLHLTSSTYARRIWCTCILILATLRRLCQFPMATRADEIFIHTISENGAAFPLFA